MKKILLLVSTAAFMCIQPARAEQCRKVFSNSLGMEFVQIEAGSFRMGRLNPAGHMDAGYEFVVDGGDWDETPVRNIRIGYPFYMQTTEVTAEQYRKFDPKYPSGSGAATGITWPQAVAFAEWLGKNEGKPYRLPTEAEWEYACRAGTATLFSSGENPPKNGQPNAWGLAGMHTSPAEWVLDWHALYCEADTVDPVGPAGGMLKVLRGADGPYHARSASRWAMPPGCGRKHGFDFGFRLVAADMPRTKPSIESTPFNQMGVKPAGPQAELGPDPEKPYFKRRLAAPIPPENDQDDAGPMVGVHPAVLAHQHSPGFAALPNGDLLAVYFSSSTATTESEGNVGFVQARLRHGCESWDMPELFLDCANYNDQSALLWVDGDVLRFFGGGRSWPREVPFRMAQSADNGATWSEATLPEIKGTPGPLTPQPITSAFRDPEGNMYFAMDGDGANSLLWRSTDGGKTWADMGGRTEGRHSAIRPVKDKDGNFSGTLLCLGTKKGLFADNWMQQNISHNWGKSWEPKTKSPFPYLSSNQRGYLGRLKDGKLIFVSDHQARSNAQPPGYTDRGCFVALSDNEGETWHVKTIPGTLPHESKSMPKITRKWTDASHADGTVGYVTVAQTPNGLIHVLTTMNHPCLHFAFNQAWIYSDAGEKSWPDPDQTGQVRQYQQEHPNGKPSAVYSARLCDDGRFFLDGTERWYYDNGAKQYEATYCNGRKIGTETLWSPDGRVLWTWEHAEDGTSTWTQFHPNDNKKLVSNWKDSAKIAHGKATLYRPDGGVENQADFKDGILVSKHYTNSVGMKMVGIEPGSFSMGSDSVPDELCGKSEHLLDGDPDEQPVHEVKISRPFMMAATEVTNEQYEKFDPSHRHLRGSKGFSIENDEAVVFVSWEDAKRFCDWLSAKEGLPYRLPTEAEWEYACRAGTKTAFNTGDSLPGPFHKNVGKSWYPDPERGKGREQVVPLHVAKTPANAWGLYDMHGNVEEWTADWYGPYVSGDQTDPVGYASGDCRVTRGGSHSTLLYYLRSANRSGSIPEEKSWLIGFRPVIGPMPDTETLEQPGPGSYALNVAQDIPETEDGPDPDRPFFEGPRQYVIIPEGSMGPIFSHHNHVPNIVACKNGDLFAIWYTCVGETGRELAIVASRLRPGQDKWDPASMFWDQPDRNDHTPAMWRDADGTLYHFNGYSVAATWGPLAVLLRTSSDNGASWTQASIILPEHNIRQMPIESIFRASDGTIVLPCDAVTGGSGGTALYLSRDNGLTWNDPGGTIAGIHACVTQLNDGTLIAYGRGDNIDGQMPKSISTDMGKTWRYEASGFPPVGGGQRPVMLKLAEGPLVLVAFTGKGSNKEYMPISDAAGGTRQVTGMYAAISYDQGLTWPNIRLVSHDGADKEVETMDGKPFTLGFSIAEPGGYLSICQADDGIIHLITSRQHYAFNLEWLKTKPPASPVR